MSTRTPPAPMPLQPPPDTGDDELSPLLGDAFARAFDQIGTAAAPLPAARGRLLQRAAASRQAEAPMHTVRRRRATAESLAPGVSLQWLYRARADAGRRPGEPWRACLLQLEPGARLDAAALGADAAQRHREWLVLQGGLRFDAEPLALRDYHVRPAGAPQPVLLSAGGALVFLRESERPASPDDRVHSVRDDEAGWPDFAPGIRRRVLWTRDGQAALLYHATAGSAVPQHSHGHDEECLMVQGELFLDDLLLQPGDYQLAPQGTGHRVTATDTGVVIYAHGDLDLRFT